MGSIKKDANKLDFIADTLKRCAIAPAKTKRLMSGYNCFSKVQYKLEKKSAEQESRKPISFKEMIKARAWSTLEPKQKETWKSLALEGCPPRLWEE